MAHEITDNNFDQMVSNSDKVVMLDFWAEWCGPCRMIGPIVEELSREYDGKAIIGKVNVDENPGITAKLKIRNIPTLLFFKNGAEVDKIVGAASKASIASKLNSLL
ncbi:MAG TPA: thioredoxin [Bacteroidales bacterium]|nr:thioredoxin [Bacteroidales bacterium]HNZ43135.1 thioredoxin [Bacteroidales bacterium]HOH83583.1 thioredoxin [Bacteroidales bacterium]HPB25879.1 thioredoxin [Bacteroidales bacterium]HPI30683.1 thioredoxin [Bacteroidales bacterium]